MYKKIDIFVNCEYVCSTNAAKSLKDAKDRFIRDPRWMGLGGIIHLDEWKKSRGIEVTTVTVHWA